MRAAARGRKEGSTRGGRLLFSLLLATGAPAAELAGTRQIVVHAQDGHSLRIGQVVFAPGADGRSAFRVELDSAPFTDHFLSMREFKCLTGGTEILCHVPYPHPQPGTVTARDPAWLEHALLFMVKKPSEFGAKLWNGVYWQLTPTDKGWTGIPQAVDLNHISAPPADPSRPPFTKARRDDMPAGARWFQRLTIE